MILISSTVDVSDRRKTHSDMPTRPLVPTLAIDLSIEDEFVELHFESKYRSSHARALSELLFLRNPRETCVNNA
jgi:hypothetical protein